MNNSRRETWPEHNRERERERERDHMGDVSLEGRISKLFLVRGRNEFT
jgi:hypothetical protein